MFLLPQSYWEVRDVSHKGRGLYARKEIVPGTVVGDYLGEIIYAHETDENVGEFYDLNITPKLSILANPKEMGIHLINHSCAANCAMFPYKGHTLFFALRRIFIGEELTIFYFLGAPTPEEEICLDVCHCGSPVCRGTMHNPQEYNDRYEAFEKQRSSKYLRQFDSMVGQLLPPLDTYPKIIEDYPLFDLFGSLEKQPLENEATRVPDISRIRELIRESGQQVRFPNLGIDIYGVMNGLLISRFIDKDKITR